MADRQRSERDQFQIDALWEAYVPRLPPGPTMSQRAQDACDTLLILRDAFRELVGSSEQDRALETIRRALVVFSLLTLEVGDWLTETPGLELNDEREDGKERASLCMQLWQHDHSIPATHRSSIDTVPVVLPRWLFLRLAAALDALGYGEVHPLVAPRDSGKHDDAWSWQQFRTRAVQHIVFLVGQGVAIEVARRRVAVAMRVSEHTLREWQKKAARSELICIEIARKAGALKAEIDSNPATQEPMDGDAFAFLQSVQRTPLQPFGAAYQGRFGHRHNQ